MNKILLDPITNYNLDNIFEYDNINYFILEKGIYEITKPLVINKNNIIFTSRTNNPNDVQIIQKNDMDGLVIKNSNGIIIRGITITVKDGNNVCFTNSNSNWTNVSNCCFYGSDQHFTVFYSGPSHLKKGESTINGYVNNELNNNNIFENNKIYSKWDGDAISFCLQNNGIFRNNIVKGCKMAIYMCKNTFVSNNSSNDSSSHGIVLSIPSENIKICNNIINRSLAGAITARLQLEHGKFNITNHQIDINNNVILDCKYIGIEVVESIYVNIYCNNIISTNHFGIYILNVSNANLNNNKLYDNKRGIVIEQTYKSHIYNNYIYSLNLDISDHGISILNSNNNKLINNKLYGYYLSFIKELFEDKLIESFNTFENNICNKLCKEEFLNIYKYLITCLSSL